MVIFCSLCIIKIFLRKRDVAAGLKCGHEEAKNDSAVEKQMKEKENKLFLG